MKRPNGDGVVGLSRHSDRDAVGLKPGNKDRSADVLCWTLSTVIRESYLVRIA